jgi:hypothetical protein
VAGAWAIAPDDTRPAIKDGISMNFICN